jgi:hypothetical protein
MTPTEKDVLDMAAVVDLLLRTRERALLVRCSAVRAGARRRVKAYGMFYDLTWYKVAR